MSVCRCVCACGHACAFALLVYLCGSDSNIQLKSKMFEKKVLRKIFGASNLGTYITRNFAMYDQDYDRLDIVLA